MRWSPCRTILARNARTLPLLLQLPPPGISSTDLAAITCRVVLLAGAQTRTFFRLAAETIADAIPRGSLREIPAARHLWPGADPDSSDGESIAKKAKRKSRGSNQGAGGGAAAATAVAQDQSNVIQFPAAPRSDVAPKAQPEDEAAVHRSSIPGKPRRRRGKRGSSAPAPEAKVDSPPAEAATPPAEPAAPPAEADPKSTLKMAVPPPAAPATPPAELPSESEPPPRKPWF